MAWAATTTARDDQQHAGYLRRTLYNMAADGWRRRGAWLRKLPLVHAGSRLPVPGISL